jgi:tRNA threonylcarbamoyl adenosine modification protein YeaZ
MTGGGPILAIDTATTRAVIALGRADGTLLTARSWVAGYRHGEELLARIDGLLGEQGIARTGLGGVVVGTGPGAFTGLRVGLATAKGICYAFGLPIAGVATGTALLHAAERAGAAPFEDLVLLQPAGPSDRVISRPGAAPVILPVGEDPELAPSAVLVALDLDGRAPDAAVALGERAHAGLAAALIAAGARRLADGGDDLARLVPEYVTLPRGVRMAVPDDGVELTGGRPS